VNIVGLGNCGCSLAEEFEKYPQYNVLCIDAEPRQSKNFHLLPKKDTPEEYEGGCPNLTNFLNCNGEVIFILGGSGHVSAASLRILEKIKHCRISILYIKSDQEFLSESARLQQRATFHILQEYARSGIFEQIILVDNSYVSEVVGEVSIVDYYEKINQAITPVIHFLNVFNNSKPVMSTFSSLAPTSRIRTVGIVNVETGEEKVFFSLDNRTETRYYYAISEKSLKEDGTLHSKIRAQVKEKDERTSFGIFKTDYDNNFCYSLVCGREVVQL
jgi:hypothetical protein